MIPRCPICQSDLTLVKQESLYCPSCKIYISKQANFKTQFETKIPTAPLFSAPTQNIAKPTVAIPLDNLKIVDNAGIRLYFSKKIMFFGLLIGLFSFWAKDFFYVDIGSGCYITITPSWIEFSNQRIKTALGIIKNVSPEDYSTICSRVNVINPNPDCGQMEGGCFHHTSPTSISVSTAGRRLTWLAEVITHEACHAKQHHEGRGADEAECHAVGLAVMQKATQYK